MMRLGPRTNSNRKFGGPRQCMPGLLQPLVLVNTFILLLCQRLKNMHILENSRASLVAEQSSRCIMTSNVSYVDIALFQTGRSATEESLTGLQRPLATRRVSRSDVRKTTHTEFETGYLPNTLPYKFSIFVRFAACKCTPSGIGQNSCDRKLRGPLALQI